MGRRERKKKKKNKKRVAFRRGKKEKEVVDEKKNAKKVICKIEIVKKKGEEYIYVPDLIGILFVISIIFYKGVLTKEDRG